MSNSDYWKGAYKDTWPKEKQRLERIQKLLADEAGVQAQAVGLGAGTTDYLTGNAASRGYEKGGADLRIEGSNIYIEVTGPLVTTVGPEQPLWLRPDKIENARIHLGEHDTWVAHILEKDGSIRVIHLDESFFDAYTKGEFPITTKNIRGRQETYREIPANHSVVKRWIELPTYIKKKMSGES